METNYSIRNNPAFGATVSENFIKAAKNYYKGVEYRPYKLYPFDRKVAQITDNFGYDEFVIKHSKHKKDGKTFHVLSADNGEYSVPITQKDQFRKVLEKFMHLTKGELYVKIRDYRIQNNIKRSDMM